VCYVAYKAKRYCAGPEAKVVKCGISAHRLSKTVQGGNVQKKEAHSFKDRNFSSVALTHLFLIRFGKYHHFLPVSLESYLPFFFSDIK